jgi:hypothetical protein
MSAPRRRPVDHSKGQALVEFSLAITIFLVLLMGVADFGRAIYMYNGVSEAARELARVTSVHPCNPSSCVLGNSAETLGTLATQKNLIPSLGDPTYSCVDISDADVTCRPGNGTAVKVTIAAPYRAVTPLLGLLGTFTLESSSTIKLQ